MKILRPVDPAKKLPEIKKSHATSQRVYVKISNGNEELMSIAFLNYLSAWKDPDHFILFYPDSEWKIITWYEEVELTSFFPDDESAYNAASNAGNGTIYKIGLHQEGQTYFKNQLLKNLRK
jgi:hypothetical protein